MRFFSFLGFGGKDKTLVDRRLSSLNSKLVNLHREVRALEDREVRVERVRPANVRVAPKTPRNVVREPAAGDGRPVVGGRPRGSVRGGVKATVLRQGGPRQGGAQQATPKAVPSSRGGVVRQGSQKGSVPGKRAKVPPFVVPQDGDLPPSTTVDARVAIGMVGRPVPLEHESRSTRTRTLQLFFLAVFLTVLALALWFGDWSQFGS